MAKIIGNITTTPMPFSVVDQTYSAESANAQSGTAVAEAINSKADKNNVNGGFNGGAQATATTGGAVGYKSTTKKGGAIGRSTVSDSGGAIGESATATSGGAIGEGAQETEGGGAIGWNSKAGGGFSGGNHAQVIKDSNGNYIDAIQLGQGMNKRSGTLQIYDYTLMNEDGSIPEERLPTLSASNVGQKTENGGEIFNDYENNKAIASNTHAEGQKAIAGSKAFSFDTLHSYVTSDYDNEVGTGKYYLNSVVGITKGLEYTVVLKNNYDLNGKVISVGNTYVEVDNYIIPNSSAETTISESSYILFPTNPSIGDIVIGSTAHAEGNETKALSTASHAEGYLTTAAGNYSHTEGRETIAAYSAHAEGQRTSAKGNSSHSEGYDTKAIGFASHSEGQGTKANGNQSHAEGVNTISSGIASHTEGQGTQATGNGAHAEGYLTKASGSYSHTAGIGTVAASYYQHAEGKYNIEDNKNKYAHIVGNGTSDTNRSNAHTLDWKGNAWFAGEVTVGTDKDKLATEKVVDSKIAEFVDSAPETLDTLNELAEALGDDPNFATTVATELGKKVDAKTEDGGFAGGDSSSATTGGAIGYGAQAREGGAVGWGAVAEKGFSGGHGAKVGRDDYWNYIDAIQLGTGINSNPKSLQVYNHTLMNADGSIPEERLPILETLATIEYVDSKIGSGGGEGNSIYGFDYYYETTSINLNDSDYQRVGIHKIKKTGSMEQPTIIMTQAYAGGLQQTVIRSNYIRLRQIKPDGTMTDWDDYVLNSKLEEKVAESKAYTDEKIGSIETVLDSIIAMQNELIGGDE